MTTGSVTRSGEGADEAVENEALTLEEVEAEHILRVLQETGGVISIAARRLGMPRTTLNAKMLKLRISRKDHLAG